MGSLYLAGLWCCGPGHGAGLSVCSPDPWALSPGRCTRRGGRRVSCSRLFLLTEDGGGSRGPDALSHRVNPRRQRPTPSFRSWAPGQQGRGSCPAGCQGGGQGPRSEPLAAALLGRLLGVWGDQPRARADLGDLLRVRKGVAHQLTGSCVSRRSYASL